MKARQGKLILSSLCQRCITDHSVVGRPIVRLGCALVLYVLTLTGCSCIQLPAIDPNGQRIFLPFPNTTQFDLPPIHSKPGEPGIIPTPAYQKPVAPPPCLDGPGGVCNMYGQKHQFFTKLQKHFQSKGKEGEIQMTPMRVVAPVGGEVVLLAGICGQDGYLVKREPLEWMLSPESVGTFIEVGDDGSNALSRLLLNRGPKAEKLDVDFARGRTSAKEILITRGTPNCDDDIPLQEGQSWLSVSSPTEGVSRVTVLAPESEIWDSRRQTATIYWVDAQWDFPPPRIEKSGQPIQLVTRVTRAENLVPAENWLVEYTIVDPSVATFDPPTGSNKAMARVNRDGQAIVNIVTPPGGRGTTPIIVDVIRPAQPEDRLPQLVLGRGQTTVTYSSPGLNMEAIGPNVGSIGELLSYTSVVGNPGDVDAENVQLMMTIPAGTRVVGTPVPQPTQSTNGGFVWDQGILGAGRQFEVSVVLEALQANVFEVPFSATAQGLQSVQRSVRTEILDSTVEVDFKPAGGVAQANLGEDVQYEIDVTNTSRQALTDLRLLIETDPGLPEAYQGENRVEQTIQILQPGETRPVGVTFRVQQQGQLAARLQVYAGQKLLAEKTTSIQGLPARQRVPDIGVDIEFPATISVGSRQIAKITVRNQGEVSLSDVNVALAIDPSLTATKVDNFNMDKFQSSADGLSAKWDARTILPRLSTDAGDTIRQLYVEFESRAPVPQGTISVRATSAEGVEATAVANFRAVGSAGTPPTTQPPPPADAPRTGNLALSMNDYGDPRIVGQEVRYDLTIRNDQNLPDRNVRVLLKVPKGVQFLSVTRDGTAENFQFGADDTIILPTLKFIRPGESITYFFVVKPTIPQLMELRAQAYSDERPNAVETSEQTTVNLRP